MNLQYTHDEYIIDNKIGNLDSPLPYRGHPQHQQALSQYLRDVRKDELPVQHDL